MLIMLIMGLTVASGCGGPTDPHAARQTAEVELLVMHGGAPMPAGNVDLVADVPGNDVGGELAVSGTVTIAAIPGRYTVVVNPPFAVVAPGVAPPPAVDHNKFPKAVRDSTKSPWKIDVVRGKNRFEFDLDIKE